MKSFDRRSFGKLLLGAIPAVFLAKSAVAETERGGFTKEDLKKCEALARKPFEDGRWGTRSNPNEDFIWGERRYVCGHTEMSRFPASARPTPDTPIRPGVYRLDNAGLCPDCRKKQIESGVVDINPYDLRALLDKIAAPDRIVKEWSVPGSTPIIDGVKYHATNTVAPKTFYGVMKLEYYG